MATNEEEVKVSEQIQISKDSNFLKQTANENKENRDEISTLNR